MKIIKRDGRIVEYNKDKIYKAILRANNDVLEQERVNQKQIDNIIKHIEDLNKKRMLVEDIQDMIETELMKIKKYELAKAYIIYRYKRALVRKSNITDESILALIKNNQNNIENQNNRNNITIAKQRNLIANEVSKDLTKRILLPDKISEAHDEGILFFHNTEHFLQQSIDSCLLNYKDMFENGTIINNQSIKNPDSLKEACTYLSQIILNISSCQYGEISLNIKHLSKYLQQTEQNAYEFINCNDHLKINDDIKDNLVKQIVEDELCTSIKSLLYQIGSLSLVNNQKYPLTLFLDLEKDDPYIEYTVKIIDEIFNQVINMNNNCNCNLIYALDESNYSSDKKYYFLTQKAIKYLSKHQNLSLVSIKMMKENYNDNVFNPLSNGHLLTNFKDKNGVYKFEGRFNQGMVSLNLPQISIIADHNDQIFWQLLEDRLDLCFEALMCRYHALLGTISNVSPFHWQNGALARLKPNEPIDNLLKHGYSTLIIGYSGLSESVKLLKGCTLWETTGEKFAIKILSFLQEKCEYWRKKTGLGFCLYGNNSQDLGHYFIEIDKEKYGIIKDITDKDFYTNTCNNIEYTGIYNNFFERIQIEKSFQNIPQGGNPTHLKISTIENIDSLIEFIYQNILFIELTKNNK